MKDIGAVIMFIGCGLTVAAGQAEAQATVANGPYSLSLAVDVPDAPSESVWCVGGPSSSDSDRPTGEARRRLASAPSEARAFASAGRPASVALLARSPARAGSA